MALEQTLQRLYGYDDKEAAEASHRVVEWVKLLQRVDARLKAEKGSK